MLKPLSTSLLLALVLVGASSASAATLAVNYSSGAYDQIDLGNAGNGTTFDELQLGAATGTLTLTSGVPQTAIINTYSFITGDTGNASGGNIVNFSVSRLLTLNSTSGVLSQPATLTIGYGSDQLLLASVTQRYYLNSNEAVDVTPAGLSIITSGTVSGNLNATFTLVDINPAAVATPEPATLCLIGSGLGLFAVVRRRKQNR